MTPSPVFLNCNIHVLHRSHWRNASQHAPLGEERFLVWFAGGGVNTGTTTGGSPDDDPDDPAPNGENSVPLNHPSVGPGDPDNPRRPEENIDEEREQNRRRTEETVGNEQSEQRESGRISADLTVERIRQQQKTIEDLLGLMENINKSNAHVLGHMERSQQEEWEQIEGLLRHYKIQLGEHLEVAEVLQRWRAGSIHPEAFREWLQRYIESKPETVRKMMGEGNWEEMLNNYDAVVENAHGTSESARAISPDNITDALPAMKGEAWETINESDKQMIATAMSEHVLVGEDGTPVVDGMLEYFNAFSDHIDKAFRELEIKQSVEGVRTFANENQPEEDSGQSTSMKKLWQDANGALGIEWYSIKHYIGAFRELKDAFTRYWEESDQQKIAKLGQQFGSAAYYIPFFGEAIKRTMDANLDDKNEQLKGKYKDELNRLFDKNLISYDDIFKPNGRMKQAVGNPNYARALLDTCAERGFLYNFQKQREDNTPVDSVVILLTDGSTIRFMDLVPDMERTIADNYYQGLEYNNKQGEEKNTKAGFDYLDSRKEKPYIDMVRAVLSGHNYWFALGVIKKAIDKAPTGDIPMKLSLLVLNHMRDDPVAKKLMNYQFVYTLGKTFGYTAIGNNGGAFAFDKGLLEEWFANKQDRNIANAGILGKNVETMRAEILGKNPALSAPERQHELDSYISSALTGKVIDVSDDRKNPIYVSIYQAGKYDAKGGRELAEGPGAQAEVKVGDLDQGFFRDQSEIVIADGSIYEEILTRQSSGEVTYPARSALFFGQLVGTWNDLDKAMKSDPEGFTAQRKFYEDTVREKIDRWVSKRPGHAGLLYPIGVGSEMEGSAVEELYRCNLLSKKWYDQIVSQYRKSTGTKAEARDDDVGTGAGTPDFSTAA